MRRETNGQIGIARRFGRAIVLHIGFLAAAVALGIFAANWIIEERLVKEALRIEAEHFWDQIKIYPEFPLPNARNLVGYGSLVGRSGFLPEALRDLPLGFHELKHESDYKVVFVSERGSQRLYLTFNSGAVRELALLFGLVPLAILLFVLYGSIFVSYRLFRNSVSPVVKLAQKVEKLGLDKLDSTDFDVKDLPNNVDQEIVSLTAALNQLIQRIESFVTREREFTRNVSHELRTPLTVINIACDLMLGESELSPKTKASVTRIKRATTNMANLVETFLLISREMENDLKIESVSVGDLVKAEAELINVMIEDKPIELKLNLNTELLVYANEKVLSGLIGNLLRNAATYTDQGHISIKTLKDRIEVADTGIGMAQDEMKQIFDAHFRGNHQKRAGHGIGMTIVKKFSDRFDWNIEVESSPGIGTQVSVIFHK